MSKVWVKTKVSILSALVLVVLLSLACGTKLETLPDGSTITFDPASATFNNITSDTVQNFTVIARYPDATPIPYAVIEITGPFAVPNGMGLYQFYYYANGTQTANNPAVDSGFKIQTDASGRYTFSVVMFATSVFKDTIRAASGTVSGTADLEVTKTTS